MEKNLVCRKFRRTATDDKLYSTKFHHLDPASDTKLTLIVSNFPQ